MSWWMRSVSFEMLLGFEAVEALRIGAVSASHRLRWSRLEGMVYMVGWGKGG